MGLLNEPNLMIAHWEQFTNYSNAFLYQAPCFSTEATLKELTLMQTAE